MKHIKHYEQFLNESYDDILSNKPVPPGKYGLLYYDTAEKLLKKLRIKISWALIDVMIDKLYRDGHLHYTAKWVPDAEKDLMSAINKIGKNKLKEYTYKID